MKEFVMMDSLQVIFHLHSYNFAGILLNYVFNNCFHQKQPPEVFFKIGVHLNFSNFTGKYLCLSLFLIKLQAFRHLRTTASVYMVNQSPPNNKRESKKRNLILSLRKVDSRKIN